jgi:hypothetical protein
MQPVSRQRISKHVPAATNTNTTIKLLLETVFSTRSVQYGYKEDIWGDPFLSKEEQRKKEKNKSLDIEQIYGRGSQRGSMPGVTVLAGCRQ